MNFLIVVDMQNDFIGGSLANQAAQSVVNNVKELVENYDGQVIFTRDTHLSNYLDTQEGKKLPVIHCIQNTFGWEICDQLKDYVKNVVDKPTFGSTKLPNFIINFNETIDKIELCGVCTDICVIANAVILKSFFPEVPVNVYASCCAGVTPQSHNTALAAMKSLQINVIE